MASTGASLPVPAEELDLLKSYLGPVSGARWWRYAADVYTGGALEAPNCWNNVDIESRSSIIEYLPDLASGRIPVADGAFTFVYSSGSLGYVADPDVTVHECARVLAPGGGVAHEIVFSELTSEDPLADLRHTEDEWQRLLLARKHTEGVATASPGVPLDLAYSHRWRVSDFVASMERAGSVDISVEPAIQLKREAIVPSDLAEPFRSRSLEDLAILAAHVYGRKR